MDIPFSPIPDLADNVAYISAVVSVVVGLLLLGWGRLWSRPVVGLLGAGLGVLCGDMISEGMEVDTTVSRVAGGSIFGVLGFVAAPFFWAALAGSLCSSIGGGFLAESFLASLPGDVPEVVEPAGGASLSLWAEAFANYADNISVAMWEKQAATMILVMAPLGLIPAMIGFWKPQFITVVMTSLVGAIAVVGGATIAMVQSDPARWPDQWSGMLIPLYIVGGLWICGMAMQGSFAMAAKRKKKAKEVARAQDDANRSSKR
ncbi:MAG: hypothetical protein GY794_03590 [bacterium]|nr:hypothetical protein [bacterium]